MTLNDLGPFDYVVAGILALFFLRGLWLGFIRQVAATLALVGSYWLAGEHIYLVTPYVKDFIDQPAAIFLLSFVVLFLAASLLFSLLGSLLQNIIQLKTVGLADRFLGGFLGLARGVILVVLGYMLTVFVLSPKHPVFDNALSVPYLHEASTVFLAFIGDRSAREDLHSALTPPPEQEEEAEPMEQEEQYDDQGQEQDVPHQELLPEAEYYYQPYQPSGGFTEGTEQHQDYPNDIPVQRREGWEEN